MRSITRVVDGVVVISLAPASLDPENSMRDISEQKYLDRLLDEILLSRMPVIVDLTRLRDLMGWELSDFVKILARAIKNWQFERLVTVSDRPDWVRKLQQQYRGSVQIFPRLDGEATKAAIAVTQERDAKLRAAG